MTKQLVALDQIEGVQKVTFGKNISIEKGQGNNYALRATFDSREIIQKYAVHPEHLKVVAVLKEIFDGTPTVVDWEY